MLRTIADLLARIGQFIAAYAPNPTFAALVNPIIIGILVQFSGVLVRIRCIDLRCLVSSIALE